MKKTILFSFVLLATFGCNDEQTKKSLHSNDIQDNCGITNTEHSDGGFWFSCGQSDDTSAIKNVADVEFKKEQLCDVYYGNKGQPKQFRCKEKPVEFKEYFAKNITFHGEWICTGLDGFGGYNNEDLSKLVFNENGSYQISLKAKQKTDSIWHVSDSVLSGTYSTDAIHKIRISPEKWTNDVINQTQFTIKDAPQFMLVKPTLFEIDSLSENKLTITSRFEDSISRIISNVNCDRVVELASNR